MVRNKSKYFDSIEAKVVEKNISTDHCLPYAQLDQNLFLFASPSRKVGKTETSRNKNNCH